MTQRILIVEDHADIRRLIRMTLEFENHEIHEAVNADEGLEAVRQLRPQLLLLDIMMPGIDGLEATRQIRALDREDAATTPIIAVSANAFADDRRLSREAGMDAHLSKPVSSQELVEALAHIAADAS